MRHAKIRVNQPLTSDVVLLFRDDRINEPTALSSVNEYGEQAISVSILPDLRAPKIKDRTLPSLKKVEIDTN